MQITPDRCAAVYEMLRHFKPFASWKLPPADEVEFRVRPLKDHVAHANHYKYTLEFFIAVDDSKHPNINELAMTIAHEMCHIRQRILKRNFTTHGADFKRMKNSICKELGWDERLF